MLGDLGKVVLDDGLFVIMVNHPAIVVLQMVNDVLSSSVIDPQMKETSVCITLFEIGDSRILPLSSTLHDGQGDNLSLEPCMNITFFHTKRPELKCHIQAEYDLQSHV